MNIELERYKNNPILMPTKNSWENKWVYNCGIAEVNRRIAILYRAQGTDNISRWGLAFSDDGYHISERLPHPVFEPDPTSEYEALGVEDPRISRIGDTYYIVYTAASLYPPLFKRPKEGRLPGATPWRVRASIAHTTNFKTFSRYGVIISHIDSKDAVLFPEKINNQFVLVHRVYPDMRLAVAEEIHRFKERGPVIGPRQQSWDADRVGAGAPPIKTPHGWIIIYHGANDKNVYSLGLLLLDLHDPSKIIGRSDKPIFEPEASYEKKGHMPNVVFTCGAIVWKDELLVYYGGADEVIGVASIGYQKVLDWAKKQHNR